MVDAGGGCIGWGARDRDLMRGTVKHFYPQGKESYSSPPESLISATKLSQQLAVLHMIGTKTKQRSRDRSRSKPESKSRSKSRKGNRETNRAAN